MEAIFYKKVKNKYLFIYKLLGSEEELIKYKSLAGQLFRSSKEGNALFFTKFYSGKKRPMFFLNGRYYIELKKLYNPDGADLPPLMFARICNPCALLFTKKL